MKEQIIAMLSKKITDKSIRPLYGTAVLEALTDFMDVIESRYMVALLTAQPDACKEIQLKRVALIELKSDIGNTIQELYKLQQTNT